MLSVLKGNGAQPGVSKTPSGSLGGGGLGALVAAGNMKQRMAKAKETIDENLWRNNLVDINRVRDMARSLWLSLEHNNEAVLRVALEIVTCRKARKVLWWSDYWAEEDGKPEQLRGIIEDKFNLVIQCLGREIKEKPEKETKAGPSAREQKLEKEVEELQRKLKLSDLSLGEYRRKLEDAEDRVHSLEQSEARQKKALQESNEEIARLRALVEKGDGGMGDEINRLKALIARMQEEESKRDAELERLRKAAAEAEAALAKKNSEPPPPAPVVVKQPEPEVKAPIINVSNTKELEEQRKKIKELEAEIESLKEQLAAAQLALQENSNKPPPPPPPPPPVKEDNSHLIAELERLRALQATVNCPKCQKPCMHCTGTVPKAEFTSADRDKLLADIKKKDAEIAKLKAAKEKWEEEKIEMLALIDRLKQQILKLQELADKMGYGDVVKEMLEEAQLTQTLASEKMSIFTRLYQDALRRMMYREVQQADRGDRLIKQSMMRQAPLVTRGLSRAPAARVSLGMPGQQASPKGGDVSGPFNWESSPLAVYPTPRGMALASPTKKGGSLPTGIGVSGLNPVSPTLSGSNFHGPAGFSGGHPRPEPQLSRQTPHLELPRVEGASARPATTGRQPHGGGVSPTASTQPASPSETISDFSGGVHLPPAGPLPFFDRLPPTTLGGPGLKGRGLQMASSMTSFHRRPGGPGHRRSRSEPGHLPDLALVSIDSADSVGQLPSALQSGSKGRKLSKETRLRSPSRPRNASPLRTQDPDSMLMLKGNS